MLLSNRLDIQNPKDSNINTLRLKEKALKFYRLIRNNELLEGKQLYQEIVNEFADVLEPDISLITGLVQLRMALVNSNFEQATFYYYKVVKLNEYKDRELSFLYSRICGLYHYLYGDLKESLEYYKNIERIGNYEFIEEVYYQMALIYSRLNKLSYSSLYLEKALEIFVPKMDYEQCTNCNLLLAVNYRRMGEFEKSIEFYNEILLQVSYRDNKIMEAKIHHNLGLVYNNLGQNEFAIEHLLESIDKKESLTHTGRNLSNTIYLLAKIFFEMDKKIDAQKWIKKGLQIAQNFDEEDDKIKLMFLKYLVEDKLSESFLTKVAIPYF
jgi:tetratricopeptide (TPR) repeat protein